MWFSVFALGSCDRPIAEVPPPAVGAVEPVPIEPEPPVSTDPLDVLLSLPAEERGHWLRAVGRAIYTGDGASRCEGCHGIDGRGLRGAIAPLVAERPWALDCVELASVVLFGTHGTSVHDGLTYMGVMPPLADRLDDLQVAAVSSFVGAEFGRGTVCEPANVGVVRLQGPMSRIR